MAESGMWISPNEGAKFWLSVLTEIHNRGVKDILIACVDGLTDLPNAIETVFPKTQLQFLNGLVFLKSAKRIEALGMIMALCLLVYNLAQRQLRLALAIAQDTIPNQLGNPLIVQLCVGSFNVLWRFI